ncbi:MAG: hypothetical protein Q4C82_00815, partial [Eubacteriales bacterium]|nr:hypothetical protein [Eubacteriales bacterium]
ESATARLCEWRGLNGRFAVIEKAGAKRRQSCEAAGFRDAWLNRPVTVQPAENGGAKSCLHEF